MRLDIYLKLSRLIPKRNLAREFTKAGKVEINGKKAKASTDVNTGDLIAISFRSGKMTVSVTKVPESRQVSKKNASELFEQLAFEKFDLLDG